MKFAATVSAFAAFAASVVAQNADFDPVNLPEKNAELPAGKPFEVTWDVPAAYKDGTVSIHLIGGDSQGTQVPISDIASGIPNSNGKYTWDVDASLGDKKVYGLVVKWEENPEIFQYSKPFTIAQGEGYPEGDKKAADETKTISKAYGTKTISLQTQEKETTSCTTSMVTPPAETTETPSPTPIVTPTESATTIVKKPSKSASKPKETTVVEEEPKEEPTKAPEASPVPESGASTFGASAVALVGAFVVAAFAL